MRKTAGPILAALLLSGSSCSRGPAAPAGDSGDPHSFARPTEVVVEHLDLDLDVDFDQRRIEGTVALRVRNVAGGDELHLDSHGLEIRGASLGADRTPTTFELGDEDEFRGRPLIVAITPATTVVHVEYATGPDAVALQWVEPGQTAGGKHPFLLTQSQSIFARTWVPCQDTPSVRATYAATVRVPPGLLALMSAENPTATDPGGVYTFRMPQPIPSYLLALAVGDLEFRELGPRSGVYADPAVIDAAAWELADTPKMLEAVEALYGPYRWGRYDTVVLPPSFPFGGMENPRLTFATPTILAGDRSLVALAAHELAHSWSGNLVTNATWNDFWLNEGFTVYLEARIMESLYGRDFTEMEALLGLRQLEATLDRLGRASEDTRLKLDLTGRSSEDSFSAVAYQKGYFFLRKLEEAVGRDAWDAFLQNYFDTFAFRSMTTERFLEFLRAELLASHPGVETKVGVDAWVYEPGLPDNVPRIESKRLARTARAAEAWVGGKPAREIDVTGWTFHEWLHFLRSLPEGLGPGRMAELDAAFELTNTGNNEILHAWLMLVVANEYEAAYPALERFLTSQGRIKFVAPLYRELVATEDGAALARRIYERARPRYHPLAVQTIDDLLG